MNTKLQQAILKTRMYKAAAGSTVFVKAGGDDRFDVYLKETCDNDSFVGVALRRELTFVK